MDVLPPNHYFIYLVSYLSELSSPTDRLLSIGQRLVAKARDVVNLTSGFSSAIF